MPIDTKSSIPQKCIAPYSGEIKEKLSESQTCSVLTETTSAQPNLQLVQKKSSFKKQFSSKKNKAKPKNMPDEDIILNNGRNPSISSVTLATSHQMRKNDNLMQTTNRIQNDTKNVKKISSPNSFQQTMATRRASCMSNNNSQQTLLQQFNRQNSIKNHPNANYRRRMSSIEQAFEKTSNINLCNLENMKSNSKLNLSNIQKSLSNINETDGHSVFASTGPTNIFEDQTKKMKRWCMLFRPHEFTIERERYSLYIFHENNR